MSCYRQNGRFAIRCVRTFVPCIGAGLAGADIGADLAGVGVGLTGIGTGLAGVTTSSHFYTGYYTYISEF